MTAEPSTAPSVPVRSTIWKTVLLLAGSAVFGGVAFALMNRRELAHMQEQSATPVPEPEAALEWEEEQVV